MDTVDCVVVGAGVIGLAVARALSLRGLETVILESERQIGTATSSRNSEIIHAGIYYPQGSLKARACVEGRQALYAYCDARGIAHRRCGKMIVATHEGEIAELESLMAAAIANGVNDLIWLDSPQALKLEPALNCVAALLSPSTGILDTHAYMLSLQGEAEAHGAVLALGARFCGARRGPEGWAVSIEGEESPVLAARHIVNAAGLGAQAAAAAIEGMPAPHVPRRHLAKGVYFAYAGPTPFQRLIYPAPEPGGLGTHLTLDMGGQARFGPDVEWVEAIDYDVDPSRVAKFAQAASRFWPGLDPARLAPAYAGVRPKISGPGEPNADFLISGPAEHGLEGVVNLFGIESPGITASMTLASIVADKLLTAEHR